MQCKKQNRHNQRPRDDSTTLDTEHSGQKRAEIITLFRHYHLSTGLLDTPYYLVLLRVLLVFNLFCFVVGTFLMITTIIYNNYSTLCSPICLLNAFWVQKMCHFTCVHAYVKWRRRRTVKPLVRPGVQLQCGSLSNGVLLQSSSSRRRSGSVNLVHDNQRTAAVDN